MTTSSRILDVAERLFGRQGYDATSLRQITREAGVNLAAVHYHFGGKLELLRAVVERRVHDVNRERLSRLAELFEEHGPAPPVEAVLEAFLEPALRHSSSAEEDEGWADFMSVVGRLNTDGGELFDALVSVFDEVRARFMPALRAALPHLGEADLAWRFHFVVGLMCSVAIDRRRIERLTGGLCRSSDPDTLLGELVSFLAAGLRAPASAVAPPTRTENRA